MDLKDKILFWKRYRGIVKKTLGQCRNNDVESMKVSFKKGSYIFVYIKNDNI